METTIKDIARICGVAVSTVSRAINNHPDINEETKVLIMQAVQDYHYIPNNSARNLKRSESNTIAVLIKGIGNPFFSNIMKVFEKEIQKKKYSFLLHRVEEHEDEIEVALQLEKEKRLKGIVFLGGYFLQSKERLSKLNIPYILSTGGVSDGTEKESLSYVSVDDYKESYKIVDYLCKLGHKRIATIAAPPMDENIGKLRLKGYRSALKDNGIEPEQDLICYNEDETDQIFSMEYGYKAAKKLLDAGVFFTAIFAISDSIAIGAAKAIFDSGKHVPEDYSIAGFDGIDYAKYYQPSITTIQQPIEDMATETIRILFDLIDGKKNTVGKIFSGELVVGQSTKVL